MKSEIRKLYLFHLLLSVSLTVVASFLFLDRLFLRMGLSMSQFGLIKGLAFLIPVTVNLLLSPYLARLDRDREILAISYVIRIFLPFLFLLLPLLWEDTRALTLACSVIFLLTMIFPMIAQSSLSAICRAHYPREELGKHIANSLSLTMVPAFLLAIPCSWYIDRRSSGSDAEFYGAFLHVMIPTAVFVFAAMWMIMRVSPPTRDPKRRRQLNFGAIREPFRNRPYRVYLHASFMLSMVNMMIIAFINPYLLKAQGLSMLQISTITISVAFLGIGLRPLWGYMCDQHGGKNVLRFSVVGVAVGLFCLTGEGLVPVLIFALLAWNTNEGIFGVGLFTGQQYLSLALSDEERTSIYIAAATFVNGAGMFLGSVIGGFLLNWPASRTHPDLPNAHYGIYLGHPVNGEVERGSAVSGSQIWFPVRLSI